MVYPFTNDDFEEERKKQGSKENLNIGLDDSFSKFYPPQPGPPTNYYPPGWLTAKPPIPPPDPIIWKPKHSDDPMHSMMNIGEIDMMVRGLNLKEPRLGMRFPMGGFDAFTSGMTESQMRRILDNAFHHITEKIIEQMKENYND